MYLLKNELQKIENKYEKLKKEIISSRKIKGSLVCARKKFGFQYYHRYRDPLNNKIIKTYIKKENINLAKKLAQQSYNAQLLNLINKKLKLIKNFIENYKEDELEQVYNNLHPAKKQLISPIFPTNEEKLRKWKDTPYFHKGFTPDSIEIYTNKGERVRSKTEKILADLFYAKNIEYKYECPLELSKNNIVYPDFTFFNPAENQEIYWEHFGMMDDPQYSASAIKKIENYVKNNIHLGEQLIITFEASNKNLDYALVEKIIDRMLIFIYNI